MPRFAPAKLLTALLLPFLILVGCATQQGIIERPDWAKEPVVWDYTGVMVSGFGSAPYQASDRDMAQMAEDSAEENVRRQIARELAKAYLKASKASISEDDAARQLENTIHLPTPKQSHYDNTRHVYFLQVFVPASRVEEWVNGTFGTKYRLQKNGTLK